MQTTINRNLLQYAVQRAITCPRCSEILDMRRAVSLSLTSDPAAAGYIPQREYVLCCKCWDAVRLAMHDLAASIQGGHLEVLDAREVFPPTITEAKRSLKAIGVVLSYNREYREFCVYLKGAAPESFYYTDSIVDAVGTGRMMASAKEVK